jgi:hypothetical protein
MLEGVALRCCAQILLIPIEKKRLLRLRIVMLRSRLQLVLYVLYVVNPYLYLTNCFWNTRGNRSILVDLGFNDSIVDDIMD